MVAQLGSQGVGKRAYAHLQTVAVVHEGCAVAAYEHLGRRRFCKGGSYQRRVILHQIGEGGERNEVTVGERHVWIHYAYHYVGHFDCRIGAVHRSAETDHAVLVRQRDVHKRSREPYMPFVIEFRRLPEMHREIVGIAGVHVLPHVRTDEEALLEEYAFVGGVAVWRRALGVEMVEMEAGHVPGVSPAAERLYKAMGHAGYTAQMHVRIGRNVADGLIGRYESYVFHLFANICKYT